MKSVPHLYKPFGCGYIVFLAFTCSFFGGCSTSNIPLVNNLPEGRTLGQLLAHRSVIIFDSTAIKQVSFDMLSPAGSAAKRWVPEDTPYVARVRNILINAWSNALKEDSAAVLRQQGRGISTGAILDNCYAYHADYALLFDSVVVQPAFPPGASTSGIPRTEPPDQAPADSGIAPPAPPPSDGTPPEPPTPTEFGPAYISCYFSVVSLTDCRKVLTMQTGTGVFELSDTNRCADRIKEAIWKTLATKHSSPLQAPVGEWN